MILLFAIVLGLVAFAPLVILVQRADEIRIEIETLELRRHHGLLAQEELDGRKRELLSRSLWYLRKPRRSKSTGNP